jgi:cytosine/adenosine deaminase-related metal-dependent hydrolase
MTKILITGGTVVSMDPKIGDLPIGDVLIEGNRIVAVAPHIQADDAQVIDARGTVVIPGLVNAHMHTWQTGLRGLASNWTVLEYFKKMHAGLATLFQPSDIYIANLVGALNQITNVVNVFGFEAVGRANGEFEFVHRAQQNRVELLRATWAG